MGVFKNMTLVAKVLKIWKIIFIDVLSLIMPRFVKIMSQFIKVLKTIIIMIKNMAHFFGTNVLAKKL